MSTYEFECVQSATGNKMQVKIDQIDEVLRVTIDGNYLGMLIMDLSKLGYSTDDDALKPLINDIVKCIDNNK